MSHNLRNSIFDGVGPNAITVNDENEAAMSIGNCLFTNINGVAINMDLNYPYVGFTKNCFYNITNNNDLIVRIQTTQMNSDLISIAFCSAKAYVTQFYFNLELRHFNHSFCSVKELYLMMIQEPGQLSAEYFNFYRNTGLEIFGVSRGKDIHLHYEASRGNIVGSKCKLDSERKMFHVNLPDGSLTLKEWILFRNEPNVVNTNSGSIVLSNCWADVLEFSNGAENNGITYENHQTFGIEVWNVPGCQFHTSGDICSDFGQRGSLRSMSLTAAFSLIGASN